MAAIDSILRILVLRDAEAITLTSGQVPSLRRAGNVERMSMPALDAAMVAGFVAELTPGTASADLAARGSLEVSHATPDGARFGVLIEKVASGYRLLARRASAAGPSRLATPPAAVPGSATGAAPSAGGARGAASGAAPGTAGADASPWARGQAFPSREAVEGTASVVGADPTGAAPGPSSVSAVPGASSAAGAVLGAVPGTASPGMPVSAAAFEQQLLALDPSLLPLSPRLASLVAQAISMGATDLLLSSGAPARIRVDGDLVAVADEDEPVEAAEILALLGDADRRDLTVRGSADFAIDGPDGRLRVNVFRHHTGLGAALRVIRTALPTPRDLRLPDDITDAVKPTSGLVLVCGPAGSGKSTTLVALVEHLNRTRARHIVTLEDPIEYRYTPRQCLVHQREIGVHAASFADGLRAALRESPDVIVVGELRDHETIAIALTAAETGHLVLGTLHAPSAAVAIDRIIDVFPQYQQRQVRVQLASVLRVAVTQYLVPARSGGRAPAIERLIVTPAVSHLIRKSELQMLGSLIQAGRDVGMIPLERSLARLVQERIVETAVARAVAQETELFDQLVRSRIE